MLQNTYTKPAFPTFFKVIAFPQFLRYGGKFDSLNISGRCDELF